MSNPTMNNKSLICDSIWWDYYIPCTVLHNHVCKLYKTRCTKSVRQNFFACRIVNIWNSLPDTVCFSSQAVFSQSLKDIDLSAYLRCY